MQMTKTINCVHVAVCVYVCVCALSSIRLLFVIRPFFLFRHTHTPSFAHSFILAHCSRVRGGQTKAACHELIYMVCTYSENGEKQQKQQELFCMHKILYIGNKIETVQTETQCQRENRENN